MTGVVEKKTGKVYAKGKRLLIYQMYDKIKLAYPSKVFELQDVDDKVDCVAQVPKRKRGKS